MILCSVSTKQLTKMPIKWSCCWKTKCSFAFRMSYLACWMSHLVCWQPAQDQSSHSCVDLGTHAALCSRQWMAPSSECPWRNAWKGSVRQDRHPVEVQTPSGPTGFFKGLGRTSIEHIYNLMKPHDVNKQHRKTQQTQHFFQYSPCEMSRSLMCSFVKCQDAGPVNFRSPCMACPCSRLRLWASF